MQQPPPLISYVITAVIVVAMLYFRLRRLRGTRPLRVGTLWIVPAIFLVLTAVTLAQSPPQGLAWLLIVVALAAGSLIGWHRGKAMRIGVDPETHALTQTASPLAIILIFALIGFRMAVRSIAQYEHVSQASLMLITDGLLVLALGLFTVQRLEMFLRAQRLLREAKVASQPA